MAHPDEALDLKRRARRRLIGAIALVLFLVIVPPWIMDLEPKPVETSLQVDIPKPDDRPLPLPAPPAAVEKPAAPAAPAVESAPSAAAPADDTAPAEAAPAEAAKEAPAEPIAKPAAKPSAKPSAKPADAKRGDAYIVPVATLSTQSGVKELQAKIALAGIKSYTEPVKTAGGTQTRVRAGPFTDKGAAEKARQRLRDAGLKPGNVTTR